MRSNEHLKWFEEVTRKFYCSERVELLRSLDSRVSRVWLCQSQNEGLVVMKQFPNWFDEEDVHFIHRFNLYLKSGGVNTLNLIPNVDGQTFSNLKNRLFALYKFEEGEDFLNSTDQIRLSGDLLGQIHKRSAKYDTKEVRKWWTLQSQLANKNLSNVENCGLSEQELGVCKLAREKTRSLTSEILTDRTNNHLVIHGDFRPENLKFRERSAVALDLDNCRRELPEMDFARSLRFLCGLPNGPTWRNHLAIFLKEYVKTSGIRPDLKTILLCLLAQPLKEAQWLSGAYLKSRDQTILVDFQIETNYLTVLLNSLTEVESILYES